ncbi:MAG: type II secretion system protein M [Armatimonadetes bacterium]|nr:type II secretion system protein M [Armatimonadota bacterium]
MRGLSPRERMMLVLVLVAAMVTVFYLFVYTPAAARHASLLKERDARRTEVERLKTLVQTREAKEREYNALAERIRLIEAKLPPEREIPRLIRQLQGVASELGIKLALLRPGATQAGPAGEPAGAAPAPGKKPAAPAAPPRYQLFRLDLAFDGTYADLMAYLGRLEDFPRFIVMTQVALSPGELPRLKVTLAANTFILRREVGAQP